MVEGLAVGGTNGYLLAREPQTGLGAVRRQIPKCRRRGIVRVPFQSALVSTSLRKNNLLDAAIPWLYVKGNSTDEMLDALQLRLG